MEHSPALPHRLASRLRVAPATCCLALLGAALAGCGADASPDGGTLLDLRAAVDLAPPDEEDDLSVAPGCRDGTRNQDETDTDCGGPVCAPCSDGLACAVDSECVSLRWNPRFVWPASPSDCAGVVFQIERAEGMATWINTRFDLARGEVQYAYVLPGVMATLVTLQLRAAGNDTEVAVCYERTSLAPESDESVAAMGKEDESAGPEWASEVNGHLATR